MIVVSNSSPLTSLAIIDRLDLLEKLFEEIYVPNAVYKEVTQKEKPFSDVLERFLKRKIKSVKNKTVVNILKSDIGAGESEAIALAIEQNSDFILIDDLKARKLAKLNELKVIGTLGILMMAKKEGYILEVNPYLEKLIENQIRISEKIKKIVLEAIKE